MARPGDSQMVTSSGPGAMMDLPTYSVIIGGLDDWIGVAVEIHEPRLIEKLRRLPDVPANVRLFAPPAEEEGPGGNKLAGVTAWQFPEWFLTKEAIERGETRSAPADPPQAARWPALSGRGQEMARRGPGTIRSRLSERPYRRYRLVLFRPSAQPGVSPATLD